VKLGTDTVAAGTPVTFTFDFHKDEKSELLTPAASKDSSTWVCGPRTYSVFVTTPLAS